MSVNLRNKQIILASNSQKRNLKKFLSGRELPYIYTSVNNKKNPNETTKYSNKKEKNNRIFLGMKNKKLKLLLSPIERVNKIKKFDNLNIPMTQRRKCISPFHSKVETTDSQKNNNVKKERRNSTVLKNSFKASSFAETQKKFDQNYFLFSNNYLFYYALLSKYNKEINDLLNKYIKDNEPSYEYYPSENEISEFINNILFICKGYFEISYKLFNSQNGNIFRDSKLFSIYTKLIKEQLIIIILLFLNGIFLSNGEFINNLNNGLYDIWYEIYIFISNYYSNYIINLIHLSTKKEKEVDLISLKKYYSNNFPPSKNKGEQYLNSIEKNTIRCLELIKNYIILTLNFSKLKGYSNIINYLLDSVDTKKLTSLIIYNIFYGELKSISKNKKIIKKENNNELILNTEIPYLPPLDYGCYKYSLVVDLDETLIYSFLLNGENTYLIRPHCFDFLNEISSFFEIIIFTAGTKDYADKILNQIDKNKVWIKYRLYREHLTFDNEELSIFKDLSKLGRDLSKTIIIDNREENFVLQPNNGLLIKTWNGDFEDRELLDLKNVLKGIYTYGQMIDVRNLVKWINDKKYIESNRPYKNINLSEYNK
jgi:Dullard-like phosphatase family protein